MEIVLVFIVIILNFVDGIGFGKRYLKYGTTVPLVTYDNGLEMERKGLKFATGVALLFTTICLATGVAFVTTTIWIATGVAAVTTICLATGVALNTTICLATGVALCTATIWIATGVALAHMQLCKKV